MKTALREALRLSDVILNNSSVLTETFSENDEPAFLTY